MVNLQACNRQTAPTAPPLPSTQLVAAPRGCNKHTRINKPLEFKTFFLFFGPSLSQQTYEYYYH